MTLALVVLACLLQIARLADLTSSSVSKVTGLSDGAITAITLIAAVALAFTTLGATIWLVVVLARYRQRFQRSLHT